MIRPVQKARTLKTRNQNAEDKNDERTKLTMKKAQAEAMLRAMKAKAGGSKANLSIEYEGGMVSCRRSKLGKNERANGVRMALACKAANKKKAKAFDGESVKKVPVQEGKPSAASCQLLPVGNTQDDEECR